MKQTELKALFNRPPKEAQAYLAEKSLVITTTWKDLPAAAHAGSFTVARAARLEVLESIKGELDRAMADGIPFSAFQKNLKPKLQALGWWGKALDKTTGEVKTYGNGRIVELGSPRRLKTIFQTNLQAAYMAGRWKQIEAEAAEAPYVQYIAVMDNRTRPSHAALNGRVMHVNDPAWNAIAPPNGFNCRCRVRNFDADELKTRGLSESKSAGFLRTESVPDRKGNPVTRTVIKLPGMDRAFSPDIGWDYNPARAKAVWDKNFNKDIDIAGGQKTFKNYDRPGVANVAASSLLKTPLVLGEAAGREDALQTLAGALGVSRANPIKVVETPIEQVVIDYGMLSHVVEKVSDARERYANFILPTLMKPYEVWLSQHSDGVFRHRYIGLFEDKNLYVIVRINKDGSIFYNMIQARPRGIDARRVGTLVYGK